MFEKDMTVGYLLDFYGELLPERRRTLLALYYNEDYSLAEIADEVGISRQGVRDNIKRGEEELAFFEQKLGLAARFGALRVAADRMEADFALPMSDAARTALTADLAMLREKIK